MVIESLVQDIELVLAAGAPFLFNLTPLDAGNTKSPCPRVAKYQINPGICHSESVKPIINRWLSAMRGRST